MSPAQRVRYRPKISLLGVVSSVLGALGALVFLQQRGKIFPTMAVGIITIVAGVLAGIVIPSLGRLVAARRMNDRLARMHDIGADSA